MAKFKVGDLVEYDGREARVLHTRYDDVAIEYKQKHKYGHSFCGEPWIPKDFKPHHGWWITERYLTLLNPSPILADLKQAFYDSQPKPQQDDFDDFF